MKRVSPDLYTEEYYLKDATGYQEYVETYGKVLEPRLERIVKEIPSVDNLNVLDIGCGRGELALWAANQGAKQVLGIDYSKNAINLANKAKRKWNKKVQNKVKFVVGDGKRLNVESKSIDAVIITEVLEHVYPKEQEMIFKEISRVLNINGFVFVHTAPSRWFNNFTYRFWSYPLSSLIVGIYNIIVNKKYSNLTPVKELRSEYHKLMHVNEPDYFNLMRMFRKHNFEGRLLSTNVTVNKPILSWKDSLYNFIIFLSPLSNYPPFNILWGNDFFAVLKKR